MVLLLTLLAAKLGLVPVSRDALFIVQPRTVIEWRRRKLRDHRTKLTRSGKVGRPAVAGEELDLLLMLKRRRIGSRRTSRAEGTKMPPVPR